MKELAEFNLDKKLIEVLKKNAKEEKLGLNEYVESLLNHIVNAVPNEVTQAAISEAEKPDLLDEINDLDAYRDSLLKDV
ncbi:MAG: toxin-antitoxin system protein [Bacteroidota bacterium]